MSFCLKPSTSSPSNSLSFFIAVMPAFLLASEAVGSRIALGAVFAYSGKVDGAGQLGNVLAVVVDKAVRAERMAAWHRQVIDLLDTFCDFLHLQPQERAVEMPPQSSQRDRIRSHNGFCLRNESRER